MRKGEFIIVPKGTKCFSDNPKKDEFNVLKKRRIRLQNILTTEQGTFVTWVDGHGTNYWTLAASVKGLTEFD